jgi:hypothetical protein
MEKGNNNIKKGLKEKYKQIIEVGAGTYGYLLSVHPFYSIQKSI